MLRNEIREDSVRANERRRSHLRSGRTLGSRHSQMPRPGQERPRVLVVDDEPLMRRAVARVLANEWKVDTASGAEEAAKLLARNEYRAIVTDFDMNGANGAWLLWQAMLRAPRCLRVLLTGTDPHNLSEHIASGVVERYLPKPVDGPALLGALAA